MSEGIGYCAYRCPLKLGRQQSSFAAALSSFSHTNARLRMHSVWLNTSFSSQSASSNPKPGPIRLCLGAFRTSPVDSLAVGADEPPLRIRRYKVALHGQRTQYIHCCNIILNFYMVAFLNRNQIYRYIWHSISGSCQRFQLTSEDIAKFQFPETPAWILTPVNINFELVHHTPKKKKKKKKSQTNFLPFTRPHTEKS